MSPLPINNLGNIAASLSDRSADQEHARRPKPPTSGRLTSRSRVMPTGIPRPASGTSRRPTAKSCLTALLSPEKSCRPSQRKFVHVKPDFPPPPRHLPRSLLPRSESFSVDFGQNPALDRASEPQNAVCNRPGGIHKSLTTPALLSPNKEITSHSLMRPIGPTLPRSITYHDIATARSPAAPSEKHQSSGTRFCLNNVITLKDRDVRTYRLKSPYPPKCSASPSPTNITPCSSTTISLDDTSRSPAGITQNTDLHEADARLVHTYELTSYWTGRYVAILDRLRTNNLTPAPFVEKLVTEKTVARSKHESAEFARIEVNIEKEAISILRSCCQSGAAMESFEKFEYLIRNKRIESLRAHVASRLSSRDSSSIDDRETKPPDTQTRVSSNKTKVERCFMTGTLPRHVFKRPSPTVLQAKQGKSKTISNFSRPRFYIDSCSTNGPSAQPIKELLPKKQSQGIHVPIQESCTDPTMDTGLDQSLQEVLAGSGLTARTKIVCSGPVVLKQRDTSSNEGAPTCVVESTSRESSRRFRKSDSIKHLVDHSIREMRNMGWRKDNSAATQATG